MKEVKILALLLFVLLAVAWMSWTEEGDKASDDAVTVVSASPADIASLQLVTRTQTVALSFREDPDAGRYPWFKVVTKTSTRAFGGSDKVDDLLKSFAPFEAKRSLGSALSDEELALAKLDAPKRKLVVGLQTGERVFEVGGRTHGSRDHYLRATGGREVFLIGSRVLGDLEFPEGRFMERKVRKVGLEDVAAVTISAGGQLKRVLHKNRLSKKEAFWADEAAPDERSETLGNYLDKVDKLTVSRYSRDGKPLEQGEPVLEVTWYDDGDAVLEHLTVSKTMDGKRTVFIGRSRTTRVPVELTRTIAEQLERDLSVLFGD